MSEKEIPRCPRCGEEMNKTGTKNQGEHPPLTIYQCMNVYCVNPTRYDSSGEKV